MQVVGQVDFGAGVVWSIGKENERYFFRRTELASWVYICDSDVWPKTFIGQLMQEQSDPFMQILNLEGENNVTT